MDDRLQRVEAELKEARTKVEESGANVRRLTLILSLFMLTLIGLVVAAAMATDIFKVEYNGVTRFQVDQQGTATINTDTNAADVALRIMSAPNSRGDIRFSSRVSDPTTPQIGDLWFNSTEGKFKIYDGFKRTMSFDGLTQVVDDATANNNNGTRGANSSAASDDPTWTADAKLGGCALSFDGTDDYVKVPHTPSIDFGSANNFTIEGWIKTSGEEEGTGNVDYIIGKRIGTRYTYYLALSIDDKIGFGIYDGTNIPTVTSTSIFTDNQWHHIAGVRDVSTDKLYLYVDGILQGQSTDTTTATISTTNYMVIGCADDGSGGFTDTYFNGLIDEVAIWNVALTPAQVSARWNGGAGAELAGNEAGLVSIWHMNDPK